MIRNASALVAGLVFGLGLWISGMTDPGKVLGFLDVAGEWDPSLMFVLGGAACVSVIAFQLVSARDRPLLERRFDTPRLVRIDRDLVLGSALFGIGWGMVGYCPGPALTSLPSASTGLVVFVFAMIAGGWVQGPPRGRD